MQDFEFGLEFRILFKINFQVQHQPRGDQIKNLRSGVNRRYQQFATWFMDLTMMQNDFK